jgi:uncharacterized protein (DUF488 family)
MAAETPTILTLGHSTRPIEAFLALLTAHGVEVLGDVRTVPARVSDGRVTYPGVV